MIFSSIQFSNDSIDNQIGSQESDYNVLDKTITQLDKSLQVADQNRNKMHDQLEIAMSNSHGQPIEVIILTKSHNFQSNLPVLDELGVEFSKVWNSPTDLVHGGVIALFPHHIEKIASNSNDELLIIEELQQSQFHSDVSTKITGIRSQIWDTLGYTGDLNMSVAVLDSGIDATHPAFGNGYGIEGDFNNKIVGWYDVTGESATPQDVIGHGTHVSGILGSNQYSSNYGSDNQVASSYSSVYSGSAADQLLNGTYPIDVDTTGTLTVDTIFNRYDSASSGNPSTRDGFIRAVFLQAPNGTIVDNFRDNTNTITSGNYSLSVGVGAADLGEWSLIFEIYIDTDNVLAYTIATKIPRSNPADGHLRYSGVAPDIKLVGVKVSQNDGTGDQQDFIDGLNWVAQNKETYNITIASASLGFPTVIPSVDAAVSSLISQGVLVIVSAGNDGQNGVNEIYSPGHVDKVITVGASNDNDMMAPYSSEGPGAASNTTKPDIIAPGGDFTSGSAIMSLDSNDADAWTNPNDLPNNVDYFTADRIADDVTPMQGTSMSTPFVSGVAALLIEAMGGMDAWNYGSATSPFMAKQLLLMTAHEIHSQSLGEKDNVEGFGRINPLAAIEVTSSYTIGDQFSQNLGTGLTDNHVTGRMVNLGKGNQYQFDLSVPSGMNLDLFIYDGIPTEFGDPVLLDKSVSTNQGGNEQITFTASKTGSFYVVIKTSFGSSGSGSFSLNSIFLGSTIDTTSPDINAPQDFDVPFGIDGYEISWTIVEENPDMYQIFRNHSLIAGPSSIGDDTINYLLDGLALGLHNFTLVVNDTWGNEAISTTFVSAITESNIPSLVSNGNVSYPLNSTGNTIQFTAIDQFPSYFDYLIDGTDSGNNLEWMGNSISINVDGYDIGQHYIEVSVFDVFGNSNTTIGYFTVVEPDITVPLLTAGSDITFEEGTSGNIISWQVGDQFPGNYSVLQNGTAVISGANWNNGTIDFDVDSLSVGVYNYTLVLSDSSGNIAVSSIFVTVLPSQDQTTGETTTDVSDTSSESISLTDRGEADTDGSSNTGLIVASAVTLLLAGAAGALYYFRPDRVMEGLSIVRDKLGELGSSILDAGSSAVSKIREVGSSAAAKVREVFNRD